MRGDQLARQWRLIWAIEASPNGLTVAGIAEREKNRKRTIYRDSEAALQAAGFILYIQRAEKANRWAFIDTFKLRIPSPFAFYSVTERPDAGELTNRQIAG